MELNPGRMYTTTRSGDYVVISGTVQTSVSGNIVGIASGLLLWYPECKLPCQDCK
jgi:hypothetical protein